MSRRGLHLSACPVHAASPPSLHAPPPTRLPRSSSAMGVRGPAVASSFVSFATRAPLGSRNGPASPTRRSRTAVPVSPIHVFVRAGKARVVRGVLALRVGAGSAPEVTGERRARDEDRRRPGSIASLASRTSGVEASSMVDASAVSDAGPYSSRLKRAKQPDAPRAPSATATQNALRTVRDTGAWDLDALGVDCERLRAVRLLVDTRAREGVSHGRREGAGVASGVGITLPAAAPNVSVSGSGSTAGAGSGVASVGGGASFGGDTVRSSPRSSPRAGPQWLSDASHRRRP